MSRRSAGVHFSASQMSVRLLKRTALAWPFFRMDKLAMVRPVACESSVSVICRSSSTSPSRETIRCSDEAIGVFAELPAAVERLGKNARNRCGDEHVEREGRQVGTQGSAAVRVGG